MSKAFLEASLSLWRRRHAYRSKRLGLAYYHKDQARIEKWRSLLAKSGAMIRRRESQLNPVKRTWMPSAIHKPRAGGDFAPGFPGRGVLHTTEGHGDATSTLDANRAWPHFEVTEAGMIIQYLGMDVSGRALKHPAGTVETNRANAFQIEVCGFAAQPSWPDVQVSALREVMRFIETNGGVQKVCHVKFVTGSSQRLSESAWAQLVGWCGHQHVPNNDHIDPGPIDIDKLL